MKPHECRFAKLKGTFSVQVLLIEENASYGSGLQY